MGVTDQKPDADVLQDVWDLPWRRRWRCEVCGAPMRRDYAYKRVRSRRKDAKYCSGKCRTAACRKRGKDGIKKRARWKTSTQRVVGSRWGGMS
jgi:hypothetical protein